MRMGKNSVVVFQGDSITDAGRDRGQESKANHAGALGLGYAHFAAAALLTDHAGDGLEIYNRGISGNRMVDLAARIKEDVINHMPSLLSVLIGVNDTWHEFGRKAGVAVDKYERLYREFLAEIRGELPAIKLVLCEPFVLPCGVVTAEWEVEIKQRRAVVKKLAKETKAVFVPFQAMFDAAMKQAPAEYWAGDGVHPTPAGHMLMARTWLKGVTG